MSEEARTEAFERLVSENIPCVVFTTQMVPDEGMLNLARKHSVSLFSTEKTTSSFMAEIIRWLGVQLARCV